MIENFQIVDQSNNIYRGGQPKEVADWSWLYDNCNVRRTVKLDTCFSENDDCRFKIVDVPIGIGGQVLGVSYGYLSGILENIVPQTYVHCEHGQDRTGLVIACYRVRYMGWTKERAEAEMMQLGFHKYLIGLWETWRNYKPDKAWVPT